MEQKDLLKKKHVNEFEAAAFLELKVNTLRSWRLHRVGPAYCKFGKAVRYPVSELLAFVEKSKIRTKQTETDR